MHGRLIISAIATGLMAALAWRTQAQTQTVIYGWENEGTLLSSSGNVASAVNVTGPRTGSNGAAGTLYCPGACEGERYLQVAEQPHGDTPQAYLAYVEQLNAGDVIDASFFGFDISSGYPSLRIWGHWALNGDVNSHDGSADGNETFTVDSGWNEVGHRWTVPAGKEALVIEARLYSTPAEGEYRTDYFIDNLTVTAPASATITFPGPTGNAPPVVGNASVLAHKGGPEVTIALPSTAPRPATDPDGGPSPLICTITSTPHKQFPTVNTGVLAGALRDAVTGADLTNGGDLSPGNTEVIFTPSPTDSGWFAFTFTASDGEIVSEAATVTLFVQDSGKVVITEIMYDPANQTDNHWEWVEITNVSDNAISLHSIFDAQLKNTIGTEHNLQDAPIPAGSTKIIMVDNNTSRSTQAFLDEWNVPERSPQLQSGDLILINTESGALLPSLNNTGGDIVCLFATDGSLLDAVRYEIGTNGWPANNQRSSIFLESDKRNTADNDVGANWRQSIPDIASAYATFETPGPPADSDMGSPGLLPSAPTAPISAPIALDSTIYENEGSGCLSIVLMAQDSTGDPMFQTFTILSDVEGLNPTTGTGGTLVDPYNGFTPVGPGSVLAVNEVMFTPTPGKSGRFFLAFKASDGTADSNVGYVMIYIQALNKVVITEIMYDPSGDPDTSWEWIEVVNLTDVDIQLHSLLDTATATITSGGAYAQLLGMTVPAQSARVITPVDVNKDLASFLTFWSPLSADVVFTVPTGSAQEWRALNSDGDDLYLYGADGSLLDVVRYKSGSGWPARNNSASIYLDQARYSSVGNDSGTNWLLSVDGQANAWTAIGEGDLYDVGSPGRRPDDAPIPILVFDFNGDGAVERVHDLATFNTCAFGAGVPRPATSVCQRADYDGDNDVDMADYAAFQRCLRPAELQPLSECMK